VVAITYRTLTLALSQREREYAATLALSRRERGYVRERLC